jgi:DNA-binding XRE family transcriptional regulator
MGINYKAIGYSNGVAYNLIDFDLSNNTGLVQLKEWIFPVWCTFNKIKTSTVGKTKLFRLTEVRIKNKMTLRDAAKGLEISHTLLANYESEKIKIGSQKLIMFANFYKCSLDDLVARKNNIELENIKFY